MKFGYVKSAVYVPDLRVADVDFNVSNIIKGINEAYEKSVEIVVFPRLCITGYTCGDLFFSKTLLSGALNGLCEIAASTENKNILAFVGLPIFSEGKTYEVCVCVGNGKILGGVAKTSVSYADEYSGVKYFSVEKSYNRNVFVNETESFYLSFDNRVFRSQNGVNVCVNFFDYYECFNSFTNVNDNAQIVVCLAAVSECVGIREKIINRIKSFSEALSCAVIFANAGAGESTTDYVFSGKSFICENGVVLCENREFDCGLAFADIDIQYLDFVRSRYSQSFHSEAEQTFDFCLSDNELNLSREYSHTPFIKEGCEEYALSLQANALKKRIAHTHSGTVVIGLSGGLDSTLALLVCVRAIKLLNRSPKDVLAVTMPCFGTTGRTLNNSVILAKSLGVTLKKVDISKTVTKHLKDIKHDFSADVTFENAQARERTQVLMDIANMNNGLVVGTGDLSETALGWATYNGDHMSMYGVNASVPKTLVRALVCYCAKTSKGKLKAVLYDILDTPVSPELLPAKENNITQVTEDIVGPYELHDFFLYHFVLSGFTPLKMFEVAKRTFKDVYNEQTILKWLKVFIKRFFAQQFKRSCVPDGVKVTEISLSPRVGLKMPSDAISSLWLKELENVNV